MTKHHEDPLEDCDHNNLEVVEYEEERMGFNDSYLVIYRGYVCSDCGDPVEGSPDEDRLEDEAERQLMEILGK